jgi:inorganic pyrophosphatase
VVKRTPAGDLDFLSPLPCPFNYGSMPGTLGADGEPLDVILLGPRVPYGSSHRAPILGLVRFLDGGIEDPKLVIGHTLRSRDRWTLDAFFRVYALAKRLGGRRPTRYRGFVAGRDSVEIAALLA